MLRVRSPLTPAVEELMHATIGCCIEVHKALGPGLLERIYARALCIELAAAGVAFDRERRYEVGYRGQLLSEQQLDFLVGGQVVLEVKSIGRTPGANSPQADPELHAYSRCSRRPAGQLQRRVVARQCDSKSAVTCARVSAGFVVFVSFMGVDDLRVLRGPVTTTRGVSTRRL
jgi:GxxExxY protein